MQVENAPLTVGTLSVGSEGLIFALVAATVALIVLFSLRREYWPFVIALGLAGAFFAS